ncbi:MAG: hypothetical protein HYY48_03195 [Gammaproteobacteria bacterium]|nr:hypothetical protein [Gammaproteobacteria bacterium]
MTDDDKTKTTAKTLWTETILEILYESLRKNRSDEEIRGVLKEVRSKGFKRSYILEKVQKKVDAKAAQRVKALLAN